VPDWPEFSPLRLLERLADSGADFVVIGGFAAVAHGSARLTNDLDVSYAAEPRNLDALAAALLELGGRLRGLPEDVPFVADARTLAGTRLLTLDTTAGPLDLVVDPPGSPGYAELRRRAVRLDLGGVEVAVAALEDLIAMKRASGRPQDLLDLEELEAIARLGR
jgi:hypothetical protein